MFALSLIRTKVLSISLLALVVLQQLQKPADEQPSTFGTLRNKSSVVPDESKLKKDETEILPVTATMEKKARSKVKTRSEKVSKQNKSLRHNHAHTTGIDSSFDPKDLDISKQVMCGWHKCYYPSKSNPNVGYLIARSTSTADERRAAMLKSLDSAWKLAKDLEKDHAINHFLLAPPISINVDKQLESRLNHNVTSETKNHHFHGKRFYKGMPAFVEKVTPAPKDRLLIGCKDSKVDLFEELVDKFVVRIKDKRVFVRQFQKSFAELREVIHHEPCLLLDFQVLVDSQGTLYHLDFDRCFNEKTSEKKGRKPEKVWRAKCYQSLDDIERRVIRAAEAVEA